MLQYGNKYFRTIELFFLSSLMFSNRPRLFLMRGYVSTLTFEDFFDRNYKKVGLTVNCDKPKKNGERFSPLIFHYETIMKNLFY